MSDGCVILYDALGTSGNIFCSPISVESKGHLQKFSSCVLRKLE